MEFKRTLVRRLFNITKFTNPTLTNCRISSSLRPLIPPNQDKSDPDPGDNGIVRRFLHRRPEYPSPVTSPGLRTLPTGEKLMEKLRVMDIVKGRIQLDGLSPPAARLDSPGKGSLTVEDARKVLKVAEMEKLKERLRKIEKSHVSYEEYVGICADGCSGSDQGLEFAKVLDESGHVIVLGDVVFLRPDQESETLLHARTRSLKRVDGFFHV